jgi:hypothetical protein
MHPAYPKPQSLLHLSQNIDELEVYWKEYRASLVDYILNSPADDEILNAVKELRGASKFVTSLIDQIREGTDEF